MVATHDNDKRIKCVTYIHLFCTIVEELMSKKLQASSKQREASLKIQIRGPLGPTTRRPTSRCSYVSTA